MSCECLHGTAYTDKQGNCGCLPVDYPTGGIKPIPVQGQINPPYNWNMFFQKTSKPPMVGLGECNIEAPSGFEYIYLNGRCVLHQIGTTRPINAVPINNAGGTVNPANAIAQFDIGDFVQENKLLVFGALAAAAYFIFGKADKPKTREVTSISKY